MPSSASITCSFTCRGSKPSGGVRRLRATGGRRRRRIVPTPAHLAAFATVGRPPPTAGGPSGPVGGAAWRREHREIPAATFSAYIAPKRHSIQVRRYDETVQASPEHTPEHIMPAVLDSVWRAPNRPGIGIVLVNISEREQQIASEFDLAECEVPGERFVVTRIDADPRAPPLGLRSGAARSPPHRR